MDATKDLPTAQDVEIRKLLLERMNVIQQRKDINAAYTDRLGKLDKRIRQLLGEVGQELLPGMTH